MSDKTEKARSKVLQGRNFSHSGEGCHALTWQGKSLRFNGFPAWNIRQIDFLRRTGLSWTVNGQHVL
jgi:hypothetical protein